MTFRHAGDLGDLCAFLPVIRAHGGGVLYIEAATWTRERLTPDNWRGLDLLLKAQPYIVDVLPWKGERVHICGNDFRAHMGRALRRGEGRNKSLLHWQLDTHGIPHEAAKEPWLSVEPRYAARVIINRSGANRPPQFQYFTPLFPWHRVWKKYRDYAVFVGLPDEHEAFCGSCGDIPHCVTANLYEAACVIQGCELFIGNQSCPYWIATAMGKRTVLEVWLQGPNCIVNRPGAIYGWNQNVELPDL